MYYYYCIVCRQNYHGNEIKSNSTAGAVLVETDLPRSSVLTVPLIRLTNLKFIPAIFVQNFIRTVTFEMRHRQDDSEDIQPSVVAVQRLRYVKINSQAIWLSLR